MSIQRLPATDPEHRQAIETQIGAPVGGGIDEPFYGWMRSDVWGPLADQSLRASRRTRLRDLPNTEDDWPANQESNE
jgi:fructose 1,6-bisphosphatase